MKTAKAFIALRRGGRSLRTLQTLARVGTAEENFEHDVRRAVAVVVDITRSRVAAMRWTSANGINSSAPASVALAASELYDSAAYALANPFGQNLRSVKFTTAFPQCEPIPAKIHGLFSPEFTLHRYQDAQEWRDGAGLTLGRLALIRTARGLCLRKKPAL